MAAWSPERTILAKNGISTLAIDLRGHGLSGRPANEAAYSLKFFAKDVVKVLAEAKITKPTIIGHCFGGLVAMTLAAYFPEVVHRLVLVDTSFKPPFLNLSKTDKRLLIQIIRMLANFAPITEGSSHADFRQFIGTNDIDMRRFFSDVRHTSLKSYLLSASQILAFDGNNILSKIEAPTLIIHGGQDSLFPEQVAIELAERIKHAKLEIIPEANHIIVLNQPRDLASAILGFVK